MTYLLFLIIFLIIPLLILMLVTWQDWRRGRSLPPALRNWPPAVALTAHVVVAVLYTTPWDNYLVANRVWWYDPALVTGWLIGWVPIEEYGFFVLQSLLTGLWLLFWAKRLSLPADNFESMPLRIWSTLLAGLLWLASVVILWSDWLPGTYLGLELVWALPPIILQLIFGADILWRQRRLVLIGLVPMTIYLSLADTLAIASGTWTISPALSLQIYLGGILPLEELLFFALTNALLVFGMTLVLARQSQRRLEAMLARRQTSVGVGGHVE